MTHRFRFYSASFSTHTKKLQTCPARADRNSRDCGQERYRFVSGLWDQFHCLDSWPQFSYFYTLSPVSRFLSLVHLNPSPGVRFLLGVVWQRQLFCPLHPPKLLFLLLKPVSPACGSSSRQTLFPCTCICTQIRLAPSSSAFTDLSHGASPLWWFLICILMNREPP